ncbi:Mus7/MMS22 family-domain-containing protein [Dipodascopsis uninucleata]
MLATRRKVSVLSHSLMDIGDIDELEFLPCHGGSIHDIDSKQYQYALRDSIANSIFSQNETPTFLKTNIRGSNLNDVDIVPVENLSKVQDLEQLLSNLQRVFDNVSPSTSSPKSTLSETSMSSPPDISSILHTARMNLNESESLRDADIQQPVPSPIPAPSDNGIDEEESFEVPPRSLSNSGHFFRKRTARQLQPYLFDRKMYEALMKRRGIKPVRAATEKRISHQNARMEDSYQPSVDSYSSQSGLISTQEIGTEISDSADCISLQGQIDPATKYRRSMPSRSEESNTNIYDFLSSSPMRNRSRSYANRSIITEDKSVPATSNTSSVFKEANLVTNDIHDQSTEVSYFDNGYADTPVIDTSDGEGSDSYLAEDDEGDADSASQSLELEHFKKRLRGVLPPSFLTLERSNELQLQRRTPNQMIQPVNVQRKGVARKKFGRSRLSSDIKYRIDESDSDNDLAILFSRPLTHDNAPKTLAPSAQIVGQQVNDSQGIEVDNGIDYMVPRSRSSTRSTCGEGARKRYSRSINTRHNKKLQKIMNSDNPSSIGVLDAYIAELRETPGKRMPLFLRVGVREASRRTSAGRTTLKRKLFVFDDDDDNKIVADVVKRWRNGTHEAFKTANLERRKIGELYRAIRISDDKRAQLTLHERRSRRQSQGIIAIVPGTIPASFPSLSDPHRKMRQVPKEHNSGDYAIRRYNQRIDRFFEKLPSIRSASTPSYTNSDLQGKMRSSSKKRSMSRKTRKESLGRPQQRVKLQQRPTFVNLDDRSIIEQMSSVITSPRLPALSAVSSLTKVPGRVSEDNPIPTVHGNVIEEFSFPVLNFSVNFDVLPLRDNIRFSPSTLIGRGVLDKALHTDAGSEDRKSIEMISFYFEDQNILFSWRTVNDQVTDEFIKGFTILVDWAISEQHNEEELVESRLSQAYEFCIFLSNFLRLNLRRETYDNIISFASALKRLTVRVMELFTDFHGSSRGYSRLSFYLLGFQLLYLYQIYAILQSAHADYSHLILDREFVSIGKIFVQVLLKYGFDDLYRFLRVYRNRIDHQISSDSYFVELWIMAINTFDKGNTLSSSTIPSFWECLADILDVKTLSSSFNVDKIERIWYAIFSMCPLYQFDTCGLTHNERYREYWPIVEEVMESLYQIPLHHTMSKEFSSYCRACFSRCLTLILTWKWHGVKSVATKMYQFFAKRRKLETLEADILAGFPDFLLDSKDTLELSSSDTVFHIFLKYLAALIRDISRGPKAKTILPGLIGFVTPLSGKMYPRTAELRLNDLDALENNYSLLLTLFWAAPSNLRPPIGHLRDVIILRESHAQARILSVKAWYYLTRLQLSGNEDLTETGDWYQDLMRFSLEDYRQLERIEIGLSLHETARRKANIKAYERLLTDSLKYIKLILCSPGLIATPEQARTMMLQARLDNIFNFGLTLPEKVIAESLHIIEDYVYLATRIISKPIAQDSLPIERNDSQESSYGDDSIVAHFLELEHEQWITSSKKLMAETIESTILIGLHQLISNLLGAPIRVTDELLRLGIEVWAMVASFLVSAGTKDWSYFIEGRCAWKWFADTQRKERYEQIWIRSIPNEVNIQCSQQL